MSSFDTAFRIIVGEEGGMSTNQDDPGNWTGGKVGVGLLTGTKYGIAASAHPTLDIGALTLTRAKQIYKTDYWDHVRGDELPPTLALLVFDAAVNSGARQAILWLQEAAGVAPDGILGPATMSAIMSYRGRGEKVQSEFMARRLMFLVSLPTWRTFGLGWSRRLFNVTYSTWEMVVGR